jgi:CheY-like chemotaxis protein
MYKGMRIGRATGTTLRLVIAVILLVLAGRAFNAGAQTVIVPSWFASGSKISHQPQARFGQGSGVSSYGTTSSAGQQLPPGILAVGRLIPTGGRLPLSPPLASGARLPLAPSFPLAKPVNYELPYRLNWRLATPAELEVVSFRWELAPGCGRLNALYRGMSSSGKPQQNCILAIDDEDGFLDFLKVVLESQSFMVHTLSNPKEAIEFYEERWREISVVLLDYLLPEMSGQLVFENLQRLNPDVRVVLLTGCEESVAEKMFQKGLRDYIQKPFSMLDIGPRVRDAINAPVVTSSASPSPA